MLSVVGNTFISPGAAVLWHVQVISCKRLLHQPQSSKSVAYANEAVMRHQGTACLVVAPNVKRPGHGMRACSLVDVDARQQALQVQHQTQLPATKELQLQIGVCALLTITLHELEVTARCLSLWIGCKHVQKYRVEVCQGSLGCDGQSCNWCRQKLCNSLFHPSTA